MLKWLKIIPVLMLVLLFTACGNNNEDIPVDKDEKVSDPVETKDVEMDSDPSNPANEG